MKLRSVVQVCLLVPMVAYGQKSPMGKWKVWVQLSY